MAKNRVRLAAVLVCAFVFAALMPFTAGAQQPAKLRIANFQNAINVALFHGLDKGYFKEAGLDIEIVNVASGSASVTAVVSGQVDIGWSAVTIPIFARSNGIAVKVFMTSSQEGPPNNYGTFIDASAKSGVNDVKDLKGKTVMINAFGTAGEVAIRERLMDAGISWDDVKKVVVPFPQMPAALELGNADVVVTIEPMHTAIMTNKAIGAKLIGKGTIAISNKQPVTGSVYFASDAWLAKNQAAALAYGRAYLRAQKDIDKDDSLRVALVMKIAGMDKATAQKIPPTWFQDIAVKKEALAPNYATLLKIGMMPKPFNVDDVIATLPY